MNGHRYTHFCVYSLSPIAAPAPAPASPSSPARPARSALPKSGKLRPILTDLPATIKKQLHQQVLVKLQQSAISASGSIFTVQHDPENPPATPSSLSTTNEGSLCFACLLRDAPNGNGDEGSGEASIASFSFLLCLLVEKKNQFDTGFELFLPDLLTFARQELLPQLSEMKDDGNSKSDLLDFAKGDEETPRARALYLLDNWYSSTVEYFTRCVHIINQDLHFVLHASMLGKRIEIMDSEEGSPMAMDMKRFLGALSILKLVHADASADTAVTIEILHPGGARITSRDDSTNMYCKEWGSVLCKASSCPFITRQKIEQKKLKVIKQLNDLKRMVDSSTLDNHELYRTVRYVRSDANKDVLLAILSGEQHANVDTDHVLRILREECGMVAEVVGH